MIIKTPLRRIVFILSKKEIKYIKKFDIGFENSGNTP